MSDIADFNKAAAKSALAFGVLQQKTAAYNLALQEVQVASAANDVALEEVKALVTTLDAASVAILQST